MMAGKDVDYLDHQLSDVWKSAYWVPFLFLSALSLVRSGRENYLLN